MIQQHIRRLASDQLSDAKLREWQRYRGWTLKILEELEHSGGMTTREISDRIGSRCTVAGAVLFRMLNTSLVERVERWGWRITRDGVFLLSLNYHNTTITQPQHNHNTTITEEKEEPAPPCFRLATCHIKRICQDKRYTLKNMTLCR